MSLRVLSAFQLFSVSAFLLFAGCASSKDRALYPITEFRDPVTEEIPNVVR